MSIFDSHDKEDDFNGLEQGSRGVIEDIGMKIFRNLINSTFVVIFHNGSNRYIDLYECGVPVISFLSNKVLWAWHGRFRLGLDIEHVELGKMIRLIDVSIHTSPGYGHEELRDLVCEEAEEVAKCTGITEPDYVNNKVIKLCVLYALVLRRFISSTGVDLGTHESNYWICDGIIQGQGNTIAWEIGDSLKRNMRLDSFRIRQAEAERPPNKLATFLLTDLAAEASHWDLLHDSTNVLPPEVTSCFINKATILPVAMFQHSQSSKLRVLHLFQCGFSFGSPPFLCCKQLRFLLLDNCTNTTDIDHPSHTEDVSCFQKLWVLDLRYTGWYWLLSEKVKSLMADLRELNVEGVKLGSISDLCGGRSSLVILRVTATHNEAPFSNMSCANGVKRSNFINDVMPSSLESFSFTSKAATSAKISSISFRGCSKLKSTVLRGDLGSLEELDLTGTAVKTLDLREVEAPNLKRLILLGCEMLRAILWPPGYEMKRDFEVMHISTIRPASPSQANLNEKSKEAYSATRPSSYLSVAATQTDISRAAQGDFNRYISVRDPRLLRSLVGCLRYGDNVHMEMDSPPASSTIVSNSQVAQGIGPDHYFYSRDDFFRGQLQASFGKEGVISWMHACPPSPTPRAQDWYVHIQVDEEMESRLLEQRQNSSFTGSDIMIIYLNVRMLHIHDSSTITFIPCPQDTHWFHLQWCRVEGCPKLRSVFHVTEQCIAALSLIFRELTTFWASQLLEARYIWSGSALFDIAKESFGALAFLHLDYCPKLIHVLPLSENMTALPCLETLEIVCCGDLSEVFPLDPKRQDKEKIIEFPKLKRIQLYELPTLQSICGSRISAPNLETFKTRGCWGLKRLPAVSGNTTKLPKVDCEKDWWDNLEWDGVEVSHHPLLYEPSHSRYYKKAHLPRGTILR